MILHPVKNYLQNLIVIQKQNYNYQNGYKKCLTCISNNLLNNNLSHLINYS
jgi:hypothetical protein